MNAPELNSTDFQDYLKKPAVFGEEVYEHLGNFCYRAFTAERPSLDHSGVWHGFSVIGRLIRYAAELYPVYAEAEGIEPAPDDLRHILLNSSQTPARFANMNIERNRAFELFFRLKGRSQYSAANFKGVEDLYKFEPDTALGTIFIADDDEFDRASRAADVHHPSSPTTAGIQCPMLRVTQTVIWPGMVNIAADTAEAFERSFAISPHLTA